MTRTLGIDLGNAKVKYVALEAKDGHPQARWAAHPLPFTPQLLPDRRSDFEAGLVTTSAAFLAELGWEPASVDRVAVLTSHFYSYPSFRLGLHHTAEMARALWGDAARLIGADGHLYAPEDCLALSGQEVVRFAATKFWGSAFLASRLIGTGLSVDTGTTSTDAIAILEGRIEPQAASDPDGFNLARLESQRLMWYGLTATPLDYAARHASAFGQAYHLYPRQGTTASLARILDLVSPELAQRHAYGGHYPSRDEAMRDLAQAFGLDRELLSDETLIELAGNLHRQLIARIAEGIARVIARAGLGQAAAIEAAVMGLGKDALARPALLACGVTQIVDLEAALDPELAAVSTAYGAALTALEAVTGERYPLNSVPSATS